MRAETLVELDAVERRFGRRRALSGLDLTLTEGAILGLAGPNGSGKTTLLRILAGLLKPTRGRARVFGRDPLREREAVMRHARFAFAPPPLYDGLTAREHLTHLGRLSGAAPSKRDVDELLDLVGLRGRGRDRVGAYSFGMRQRLALAQAMWPRPRLLVLDEPTDGLDPLAVLELREILARLRIDYGVTVLLSSHLLIELDQLVDELLVLEEGSTLFHGPPAELRNGAAYLFLDVDKPDVASRAFAGRGLSAREVAGGVALPAGSVELETAREVAYAAGFQLNEFRTETPSLETAMLEKLRQHRAENAS